jgi:hypothetical protein
MNKLIFLILSLTAFLGCEQVLLPISDNSAPKSFKFGDTVSVAYHQTVFNDNSNLSIRFKDLVADSRCPIGLMCDWAGDAEVEFSLTDKDSSLDFNLHTHWNFQRDTVLAAYHIKLVDVKPYPHVDYEYRKLQYETFIIVEKR